MLKVENMSKRYDHIEALDNISFGLETGKLTTLLGVNGSGKSSLLNVLSGNEIPDKGSVTYKNIPVTQTNFPYKHDIFYVHERIDYRFRFSVNEYISMLRPIIPRWNDKFFREMEKERGINFDLNFQDLSRGQKMQTVLMIGLASSPEILLLDEITSVIDPQGRKYFLNLIKDFVAQGKTVLVTTNVMSELEFLTDNLIILKNKNIVLNSKVQEIPKDFVKIRLPESSDLTLISDETCVPSGTNFDQSVSYVISKKRYEKENLPLGVLDQRSLTLEEVFIYYSKNNKEAAQE